MPLVTIIFIGLALSMDTFAVSVAGGIAMKQLKVHHALRIGLFFGLVQAAMLFIGYLAGVGLKNFISSIDHWIAFIILSAIGLKMIYEALKIESIERKISMDNFYMLVVLSFATSIDALAVGISLVFLKVSILSPVAAIGIITFLASFSGIYAGDKFGHFFENKAGFAAGVILIIIGIKILLEHLLN